MIKFIPFPFLIISEVTSPSEATHERTQKKIVLRTQAETNTSEEICKFCIINWDVIVVVVNTTTTTLLPVFVYRPWTHSFALHLAYELLVCLEYSMTLGSVFPWLLKARHLHGWQEKLRLSLLAEENASKLFKKRNHV